MVWGIIAIYTTIIYATIPFARSWLNLLRELLGPDLNRWINFAFIFIGFLFVGYLWKSHALERRQWISLVVISLVIGVFINAIGIPEERIHILQYAGLGYLLTYAFSSKGRNILVYHRALGLVFLIGIGDELIQGMLPSRVFDLRDIFFNAIGGITGIVIRSSIGPSSITS